MAGPGGDGAPRVLTVSELTRRIRGQIEQGFSAVWVSGEISNFKHHPSGHMYFSLKDEGAQLQAVVWRSSTRSIRFRPEDGLEVVAGGHLTVYDKRGNYQLIVRSLEPKGIGALQLAFEERKRRLVADGVFDPARKRSLPFLPRRIALVTSSSGAAVRDMIRVALRRFPSLEIVVVPVAVQGEESAPDIVRGIRLADEKSGADVMIVGRGGGSLEDLFAFNTEEVARALASTRLPVISAVGHEVDTTLADHAADRRAPTPSAAAEIAVPEAASVERRLEQLRSALGTRVRSRLRVASLQVRESGRVLAARHPREWVRRRQQQLDELSLRLAKPIRDVERHRVRLDGLAKRLRLPTDRLERARRELTDAGTRLRRGVSDPLSRARERMLVLAARLDGLGPLAILERGYSITRRPGEEASLVRASDLEAGDRIETRLATGSVVSVVETVDRGDEPDSEESERASTEESAR